jgi:hypothetical protein
MDLTDVVAGGRQRVVGVADVVRIPMRRWRTVLGVAGGVLVLVSLFLLLVPATYTATSVVVLRPVVTDPFTLPSGGADRAINMTAENGIAGGNAVIDKTSQVINRDPDDVRDALRIEIPIGGQVLRFAFDSSDEQLAVLGANAAAGTYLQVRENIYKEQRASLLLSYDSTIKQVSDQLRTAKKELPSGDSASPRTAAVLDQVRALNDQVAQLANQRAKIASADLSPGAVTAEARTPAPSSHDAAPLFLIGGLLGGLLFGMVAAHAREAFDRRVRTADQASELSGLPALGVVRASRRRDDATADADARYVALAVMKELVAHTDRPLVVLSSRADEGRTTVSGNLAVAMAEAGYDVQLAAPVESHEELRRILYHAQRRTPPVGRTSPHPAASVLAAPGQPVNGAAHRAAAPDAAVNGAVSRHRPAPPAAPAGLTSTAGVLQVPGGASGVDPRSGYWGQGSDATVLMSSLARQSPGGRAGSGPNAAGGAPVSGGPVDGAARHGGASGTGFIATGFGGARPGGPGPGVNGHVPGNAVPGGPGPGNPGYGPTGYGGSGYGGAGFGGAGHGVGTGDPDPDRQSAAVLIGGGAVRLTLLDERSAGAVVVVDAPPSDIDERGVRAAQAGVALLVVARDKTRNAELSRVVDRLRTAGAQTVGFVLTGGPGA